MPVICHFFGKNAKLQLLLIIIYSETTMRNLGKMLQHWITSDTSLECRCDVTLVCYTAFCNRIK